jgi:hypothetical protein
VSHKELPEESSLQNIPTQYGNQPTCLHHKGFGARSDAPIVALAALRSKKLLKPAEDSSQLVQSLITSMNRALYGTQAHTGVRCCRKNQELKRAGSARVSRPVLYRSIAVMVEWMRCTRLCRCRCSVKSRKLSPPTALKSRPKSGAGSPLWGVQRALN